MQIDDKIRQLAKSSYYQNLFSMSKKCANIQIFDNVSNFSGLQIYFLYWLSVYDMLHEELAKHEDDLLSQNVIDDNYRCDSYLVYRHKKHDHLWKQHRREEKLREIQSRHKNKKNPADGKQSFCNVDFRREE